jgi:hypothetical protein
MNIIDKNSRNLEDCSCLTLALNNRNFSLAEKLIDVHVRISTQDLRIAKEVI